MKDAPQSARWPSKRGGQLGQLVEAHRRPLVVGRQRSQHREERAEHRDRRREDDQIHVGHPSDEAFDRAPRLDVGILAECERRALSGVGLRSLRLGF